MTLRTAFGFVGMAMVAALHAQEPAQRASGTVAGFDGRPAAGIEVRAIAANGELRGGVLTGADGTFAVASPMPFATLHVQCEGVVLTLPLAAGDHDELVMSFAGVPCRTLQGTLVDPGGLVAPGVDLLWRDRATRTLASCTTDAHGGFSLRTNQPVHDVVVDPLAWHHVHTVPAGDAALVLDLRPLRDEFFALRGKVHDERGRPARDRRVDAHGSGARVASASTDAHGAFLLWCRRPVTTLKARDGVERAELAGDWRADATVDLDERLHGYVLVLGHVVDAGGKGVGGAAIFVRRSRSEAPPRTEPDGMSRPDGSFCVRALRDTTHLWVFAEDGNRAGFGELVAGKDVRVTVTR